MCAIRSATSSALISKAKIAAGVYTNRVNAPARFARAGREVDVQKFKSLTAVAAPLPMINVDTDMIIPKQFLKTIERTGLGRYLFAKRRF